MIVTKKLLMYILSIIVLFSAIYCSIFCLFYGITMEDWIFMLISIFFAGIAYYWNMAIKPFEHEYTIKIINVLKKLAKENDY